MLIERVGNLTILEMAKEYFHGYGSPYDELVINALEKQIPREQLYEHGGYDCSICGLQLPVYDNRHDYSYCPYCGQRIEFEIVEIGSHTDETVNHLGAKRGGQYLEKD